MCLVSKRSTRVAEVFGLMTATDGSDLRADGLASHRGFLPAKDCVADWLESHIEDVCLAKVRVAGRLEPHIGDVC